jgi:hypothetical protein
MDLPLRLKPTRGSQVMSIMLNGFYAFANLGAEKLLKGSFRGISLKKYLSLVPLSTSAQSRCTVPLIHQDA